MVNTRSTHARFLPLAALVVPSSILVLLGWVNWQSVWASARADMQRSSVSIAEYASQSLEGYAAVADGLNERLRGMSDTEIRAQEEALHLELRASADALSRIELTFVLDRDGFPILSSSIYPTPPVSLADRPYFQALSGPDAPSVYVSSTFLGRLDNRLLFSVAIPRQNTGNAPSPDGFAGVALASVDPLVLSEGMRRLLGAPDDKLVLLRNDGAMLATTHDIEPGQTLPSMAPDSDFVGLAGSGIPFVVYESASDFLNTPTLIALQKVDGFPVYAVSLRPRSAIVAAWWQIMLPHLAFGLTATLGLLLLGLKVAADQGRLADSNLKLAAANDLSKDRLGRSMRFGMVGTFEFDLRSGESRRSPEYLAIHGLAAAAAIETHLDWEKRLYPADRERALNELRWALSDESGATEYSQTYRIVTSTGDIRWIASRGVIRRDAMGRATILLGAHVDVTPLQSSQIALAESDTRLRLAQDAIGIGSWEWVTTTAEVICSGRMLEIFGINPGSRHPHLRDLLRRVHPDDRAALHRQRHLLGPEEPLSGEFRVLPTKPDDAAEPVWVAVRAASVALDGKGEQRVIGIAYDISDRKRDEQMLHLMAQEVEHRAQNSLAMISAMLRLTRAGSAAQLAKVMDHRIRALSSTLGLLRKSRWSGADLRDLITEAVGPFVDSATGSMYRLELSGKPIQLQVNVAQPLSMAIHELATNASKYGALSRPEGRLSVSWIIDDNQIHILWKEQGGPPVSATPDHTGFGSQLVNILFEGQLGGTVVRDWTPDGLVCRLSLPQSCLASLPNAAVA